jgi:hypothetical protein
VIEQEPTGVSRTKQAARVDNLWVNSMPPSDEVFEAVKAHSPNRPQELRLFVGQVCVNSCVHIDVSSGGSNSQDDTQRSRVYTS